MLSLPPPNAYVHGFRVLPEDIDGLGHANNVSWVQWVNDAAIAHSGALGLDHARYLELGVLWVVRRHDIEYLLPALAGQDLEAVTWIASARGATSERKTLIRPRHESHLLLRATTTWALIDADSGKPRRIPADLMKHYGLEE